MRAVWSFWYEPFAAHRAAVWVSEKAHLLAWVLSFENARRHFSSTMLVTDDAGARLLVDDLGLEFDRVSLALNALHGAIDPAWWTVAKLVAMAEQEDPFLHLDADVFLWKALPAKLVEAPLFAQNPEPFEDGHAYYRPEAFEAVLGGRPGAWLPSEWGWYRNPSAVRRGECCGIVGGSRVDFLQYFAGQALRLLLEPANQSGLAALPDPAFLTVTLEQYLLAACLEHHRNRLGSPYCDIAITYLFRSWADATEPGRAAERGYTHLIAGTKRDPVVAERLERRTRRDYPGRYERCLEMTGPAGRHASAKGSMMARELAI